MNPTVDPTHVLDDLRQCYLSHLLVAGITRFDIGAELASGPKSYEELSRQLGLADRPATVLFSAWRAMNLIDVTPRGEVTLTETGMEKVNPENRFNLRGYIGLSAASADVQRMIECLEQDSPGNGVSFVFHQDAGPSALDDPEISDGLTRAMADRARNVAPAVASALDLSNCRHLLDVGGAHGLYSIALLERFEQLQATIVDRQPPLRVAAEFVEDADLTDRIELQFGDIHQYSPSHEVDCILMANILHDYGQEDAHRIVADYAKLLPPGGRIVILDAFLDSVDPGEPPIAPGSREVAAYSAMLFSICEGRCYRLDEYQTMLRSAGLELQPDVLQVPAHGSLLTGVKVA